MSLILLVVICAWELQTYPVCNRMRKHPGASGIRRTFRPVEGSGEGSSGPTGGLRGTSLPAAALPKEGTDKRPLSAHSVLNSITRHSSLKAKVESPQFRRGTPAGRSKSFSNHRPLEPEVFSPIEHSSQVAFSCSYDQCCHVQYCLLFNAKISLLQTGRQGFSV